MTQNTLKELYNGQYATCYDETHALRRIERLLARMPVRPRDNVADFGCGSGMLMPFVAPHVNSYTGVDFSRQFIAIADAKRNTLGLTNVMFECASIDEFCSGHPGEFDAAFALDFAEHVLDSDWLHILTAVRTSLVRGGALFLHTPNRRFFLEIMKNHNFIVKQFPEHVAVRSVEENTALLVKAGFRISRTLLIPHYNILRLVHPLSFVPFAGAYFKARIFIEAKA